MFPLRRSPASLVDMMDGINHSIEFKIVVHAFTARFQGTPDRVHSPNRSSFSMWEWGSPASHKSPTDFGPAVHYINKNVDQVELGVINVWIPTQHRFHFLASPAGWQTFLQNFQFKATSIQVSKSTVVWSIEERHFLSATWRLETKTVGMATRSDQQT